LIEVEDLSASYGDGTVVRGVSLRCHRGEIVSLLGPNGSGKTTVLRAIIGILPEFGGRVLSGSIRFDGHDILGQAPHKLLELGLAFVPAGGRVFPRLSVRENLLIGASIRSQSESAGARLQETVALLPGVGNLMSRRAGTLSGGERQLVALGRALMSANRCLLLDEPSAGLSSAAAVQFMEVLESLAPSRAILFVEQNVALAARFSNRAYILKDGKVAREALADEIIGEVM